MIETKELIKNSTIFVYFGVSRPVAVWMSYVRTMFDSALQMGKDMFSGIGLAAKSLRVAFFNVVHDWPLINPISKRIAAIDKSTPLWSLDLKRHLTLSQ
jgi:hypothetical protein